MKKPVPSKKNRPNLMITQVKSFIARQKLHKNLLPLPLTPHLF